jgi:hypothetical protein
MGSKTRFRDRAALLAGTQFQQRLVFWVRDTIIDVDLDPEATLQCLSGLLD